MYSRPLAMLLGVGLVLASVRAADEAPKKEEAPKNSEAEVRFHDGSVIRKVTLPDAVEVATKYGKLTIPNSDIRRIKFGLHVPPEIAKKVEEETKKLTSNEFPQREAAAKELVALGRYAYPALLKLGKDADLETTRRVEAILKDIKAKVPEYQLKLKEVDLVYTTDSVFAGRVVSSFKGRSEHLGELTFKTANLREIRSLSGDTESEVTVDAAKHGPGNDAWMDTDFTASPDNKLTITASGQVDLVPMNAGQFPSGPEGSQRAGMNGQHLMGTLLGKIGENGKVFVVGKRYEGKPEHEGKVYLRIVPVGNGVVPSGTYKVKLMAGID